MSTEVASRIGRVRRSLHDRRKKGRERKARKEKRPLPSLLNSLFFLSPIPLPTPPPLFLTPAIRGTLALGASRTFSQVFLSRVTKRQLGRLLNLHLGFGVQK